MFKSLRVVRHAELAANTNQCLLVRGWQSCQAAAMAVWNTLLINILLPSIIWEQFRVGWKPISLYKCRDTSENLCWIVHWFLTNVATCGRCWQAASLEETKDPDDNYLKSWVEESPHPYENDSIITKVSSKFSWHVWLWEVKLGVQTPKTNPEDLDYSLDQWKRQSKTLQFMWI